MARPAIRIQWHNERVQRQVGDHVLLRLGLAADYLVAKIRDNIDTPAPPHSPPGQFPHRMSGELYDSVGRKLVGRGYHIYASAPHAMVVEQRRSYLRRTLAEEQRQVVRITLAGGMRIRDV